MVGARQCGKRKLGKSEGGSRQEWDFFSEKGDRPRGFKQQRV